MIDRDVLRGRVKVKLETGKIFEYGVADIKRGVHETHDIEEHGDEDTRGEWAKLESSGET